MPVAIANVNVSKIKSNKRERFDAMHSHHSHHSVCVYITKYMKCTFLLNHNDHEWTKLNRPIMFASFANSYFCHRSYKFSHGFIIYYNAQKCALGKLLALSLPSKTWFSETLLRVFAATVVLSHTHKHRSHIDHGYGHGNNGKYVCTFSLV